MILKSPLLPAILTETSIDGLLPVIFQLLILFPAILI
jgi:hypothetical protein